MSEYVLSYDVLSPEILLLLLGTGFLIGIINTLAGSGTAISYAVFMFLGLPPACANGTVRIGVALQTSAVSYNFFRKGFLKVKKGLFISVPIILGSIAGAEIAVNINQTIFMYIIGIAVVFMLFIVIRNPEYWLKGQEKKREAKPKFWQILIYFLIGVYGGFIHIGTGVLLLSALVLISGYDLLYANSYKVFIVSLYTPFALVVFILNDDVNYLIGLISAVGNIAGGLMASNFAIKYGVKALRWILITVLSVFGLYLLGVGEFVASLFSNLW